MNKTLFELFKNIEKLSTQELEKLRMWVEFNLDKRAQSELLEKSPHNI